MSSVKSIVRNAVVMLVFFAVAAMACSAAFALPGSSASAGDAPVPSLRLRGMLGDLRVILIYVRICYVGGKISSAQ
jgi:hypothetical protein